jgi:hypothetical protein
LYHIVVYCSILCKKWRYIYNNINPSVPTGIELGMIVQVAANQTVQFWMFGTSRVVEILRLWWFHFIRRAMPLSVITMVWSSEQRGFAVRTFFENGRSFIVTQRAFRLQFNLARHDTVFHYNVIANWVFTFEETDSALKHRGLGRPKTTRTTENLTTVREAIVESSMRSARKH